MRAYWKLWRDVRGRFIIAAFVMAWQVYSMTMMAPYGTGGYPSDLRRYPTVCAPHPGGRQEVLNRQAHMLKILQTRGPGVWSGSTAIAEQDFRVQEAYCAEGESPTQGYQNHVATWLTYYRDIVWANLMPLTMMFLGILLAVGSPLSGESSEATTLTFSLPWSRTQWLRAKVLLTATLLMVLVMGALAASMTLTRFPVADQMIGGELINHLTVDDALPAVLAAFGGLSFGLLATMLTRNSLTAAVSAALVATAMAVVDLHRIVPVRAYAGESYSRQTLLELTGGTGVVIAILVIAYCLGMTWARLKDTDF